MEDNQNAKAQPFAIKRLGLVAISCCLAACVSAPEQPVRATSTVAPVFEAASQTVAQDVSSWWTFFDDPLLEELVNLALAENASLDAAAANVERARRATDLARLGATPSTTTSAAADVGRAARPGQDVEASFSGSLGARWELDAFGRIRANIAAAEFAQEAAEQARRDVAVIVAASTAQAYLNYRGAEARLDVARLNASVQEENLGLLKTLFDNGRATQLDMERAQAQFSLTKASIPRLAASRDAARFSLQALTGANDLTARLSAGETSVLPELETLTGVGSPAELVRRRPDIRQAEAEIERRLSLSKAARADLFPTFQINASVNSLFSETNTVGNLNSFGFGIGPSLQWAGPDLRRVKTNIAIVDADAERALAQYEQTVRDAVAEVETAASAFVQEKSRRADLDLAQASAERALELARLRFQEGLDDYLDVLSAQQSQLDAADRLTQSRIETSRQAIALYRALGGIIPLDPASPTSDTVSNQGTQP